MSVFTLQVSIPSGTKVQVSTAHTLVRYINFQNNGSTNAMRVGDSSTSSTVGHNLVKTGGELAIHTDGYFCDLSDWWIVGTSSDVCDITYIT
jgi:hypothetical protein